MDTIVAIATAHSKSAIGIVRLSGDKALDIALKLLKRNTQKNEIQPRIAKLCFIYDSKYNVIDKAILIYFKAPNSFTGEDIVEIQCHGGILIAQEILNTCIEFGAILAKAGEFSMRALKNGKMDLLEIETTIALINNTNTNLSKLLTRNLKGECTKLLESIRLKILEIIAQIEVNIDYSDEDLDSTILQNSLQTLTDIMKKFQSILESTKHYNKIQNIKLCILGKPNVGKSSLLNLLLMKDRAIVSEYAGTTRDAITELLDINGNLVCIADTAGIRDSKDYVESQGIERSFEYAKESDFLLCVFDLSKPMDLDDLKIIEFLKTDSIKDKFILIVLNKNDLEIKNKYDFTHFNTISLNTRDIKNRSILQDQISKFLIMDIDKDTLILTSITQSTLLESAQNNLYEASNFLQNGLIELASYELTQSLNNIAQMTKPYNIEEVLDSMFSQFCVGK